MRGGEMEWVKREVKRWREAEKVRDRESERE